MTKIQLLAKLISRATRTELSEQIVDDFILFLAKVSEEFYYAAQKVVSVDPTVPSSVLIWVTDWIRREDEVFVTALEQLIHDFEQKGYEVQKTSGYVNIYGPKFPQIVFEPSDEAILRGLGFRLRTRPDSTKGNRCKWWITREGYTPGKREALTDEEIHRIFG